MSDNAQIIVDVDAGPADAEKLAAFVREWLIREGIIVAEPIKSDRGNLGGHAPGANYHHAIKPNSDSVQIVWENGVQIARHVECTYGRLEFLTGRRVFDAGGNGIELECARCEQVLSSEQVFGAHDPSYLDAVGLWFGGDERVTFPCPWCGERRLLTEWRGPFPWAFGYLGFKFWNWPPLAERFIQEITGKLGHRTILVHLHI